MLDGHAPTHKQADDCNIAVNEFHGEMRLQEWRLFVQGNRQPIVISRLPNARDENSSDHPDRGVARHWYFFCGFVGVLRSVLHMVGNLTPFLHA